MYNKKCKDHDYFIASVAITFCLNRIKGEAHDKEVEELTDDFMGKMKDFNGAMVELGERRKRELG